MAAERRAARKRTAAAVAPVLWAASLGAFGVVTLLAGAAIEVGAQAADQPRSLSAPAGSVRADDRVSRISVNDPVDREASLELRASRRAYEGAPPVIPHPTKGINVQTCRECHKDGLRAGDLISRKASHQYLVSCTQCHVEEVSEMFGAAPPLAPSAFAGVRPGGNGGDRAHELAPPTIPHAIIMRTNCNSCHGVYGYKGLLSGHTERLNCVQCHAPDARFDQLSPFFQSVAPLLGETDPGAR